MTPRLPLLAAACLLGSACGASGPAGDAPEAERVEPAVVEQALRGSGWERERCVGEGTGRWSCRFGQGDRVLLLEGRSFEGSEQAEEQLEVAASAEGERRGRSALLVRVLDASAARSLRDELVPPGDRIDDLVGARVSARAAATGWRLVDTEQGAPDREGRHRTWTLEREGHRARVVLFDAERGSGHGERSTTHGVAELVQGLDTLRVQVLDRERAREALEALPGTTPVGNRSPR